MASELEAEWEAFKRHKFPGIRIQDRTDSIHFSQRVHLFNQRANAPIILVRVIGGLAWVVPAILIGMASGAIAGVVYFLLAAIPVGLAVWLAYIVFRDRISVNIYPGKVIIKEGRRETALDNEDIQKIDVRGNGSGTYSVYVWNHKIPILTLSQDAEHRAIALREGILLAADVVNAVELVPGPKTPQAKRRTFDE